MKAPYPYPETRGPIGLEGPPGPRGPMGPMGLEGPQGPMGLEGERGPRGPRGLMGPIGLEGDRGKDGKNGKDGKDGKDAVIDYAKVEKTAEFPLKEHEKKYDHSLIDPFLVGSYKVDEKDIDDGKVLMYDRKSGRIIYSNVKTQTNIIQQGGSGGIPQQSGNSGKFLKTVNGRLVWGVASSINGVTRSVLSVSVDTSAAAALETDYVYLCSGTMTLTLPTAVGNTNLYTIKNVGAGTVTVAFTGGQTGDGSSTLSLPVQYTSLDLISDNTNWNIT